MDNSIESLSTNVLGKIVSEAPSFAYECELIRRMTLRESSRLSTEAQKYFHDVFSKDIIQVLANRYYIEDYYNAQQDYYTYLDEVKGQYNYFVVKPDSLIKENYALLIRYKKRNDPESSKLIKYVMACSIRYFVNLYKERKRKNVTVPVDDETLEKAKNRTQEEDARIMIYKYVCPDDTMSNDDIIAYGNELLDRIIGFLPSHEQDVIKLTFFMGYDGIEAYNELHPENAYGDDDPVKRKNKQDYISHLRSRALIHLKQIKQKIYGE